MVSDSHTELKTRFFYLDILRALAIIAVLLLHNAADLADQYATAPHADWFFAAIYTGLSRFCVPMFVLLSGSLLLDNTRKVSVKELFSKRLPKLLIPLVVWSAIYVAFLHYSKQGFVHFNLAEALLLFSKGPVIFHFWFLYMMIGIYLIYPVINAFITAAPQNVVLYFIIIWFTVNCVLQDITTVTNDSDGLELYSFTGYIGYFVLGYYLKNTEFSVHRLKLWYVAGLVGFIVSIAGMLLLTDTRWPHYNDFVESDFTPDIPFAIAGLFLFMKNFKFSAAPSWWKTIITGLSKDSYGIYIVHVLVMQTLFNQALLYINITSITPGVLIPLKVVVVLAISYFIVKLVKLMPLLRSIV